MVTSGTRPLRGKCEDYSYVRYSVNWAEVKLTSWIDVALVEGKLHFFHQTLAHLFASRHMSEITKSMRRFESACSCQIWIVTKLT